MSKSKKKIRLPPDFNRTLFKADIQTILDQKISKRKEDRAFNQESGYGAGWIDAIKYALNNIDKHYEVENENQTTTNP